MPRNPRSGLTATYLKWSFERLPIGSLVVAESDHKLGRPVLYKVLGHHASDGSPDGKMLPARTSLLRKLSTGEHYVSYAFDLYLPQPLLLLALTAGLR